VVSRKAYQQWFTDKNGLFVRVNPMRNPTDEEEREARKKGYAIPLDTYVTSFRHALIEADKGDKEAQLGALRRIGFADHRNHRFGREVYSRLGADRCFDAGRVPGESCFTAPVLSGVARARGGPSEHEPEQIQPYAKRQPYAGK